MAPYSIQIVAEEKCFNGIFRKFSHFSKVLGCEMKCSVFLPPKALDAEDSEDVPLLYFLSGLTCNEDNFITKAGALFHASRLNLALVCPDTSPRGVELPDHVQAWDIGPGAGFYVDATTPGWSKHYKMYSYIVDELPLFVNANFSVNPEKAGIFGHSMGGHGALVCALRNPGKYQSVSAFAPICHPSVSPWGKKALSMYLSEEEHSKYDATALVSQYSGPDVSILIDQGTEDPYLAEKQLLPEDFAKAADSRSSDNGQVEVMVRMQEGYGHGYWFAQTFIAEHLEHHARWLKIHS